MGLTWDRGLTESHRHHPCQPLGLTLSSVKQVPGGSQVGATGSHLGYLPGVKHVVVAVHGTGSADTFAQDQPAPGDASVVQEVIRRLDDDLEQPGPAKYSHALGPSITVDVPDRSHLDRRVAILWVV